MAQQVSNKLSTTAAEGTTNSSNSSNGSNNNKKIAWETRQWQVLMDRYKSNHAMGGQWFVFILFQ